MTVEQIITELEDIAAVLRSDAAVDQEAIVARAERVRDEMLAASQE
jgi:hypothetical protein